MTEEGLLETELELIEARIIELKLAGYRINEQLSAQYEILKSEYKESKNQDK